MRRLDRTILKRTGELIIPQAGQGQALSGFLLSMKHVSMVVRPKTDNTVYGKREIQIKYKYSYTKKT